MNRELLKEQPIFEDIEIEELTEAEDDGLKLLKIKGTASRGDVFNKNNRMYPTKVLKKVAEKIQPSIKKGKMTGQLDHPSWFDGGGLKGTAIKFTEMWMEGDYLKFEGNVIPTTAGKELEVLLKSKVGIGMSTRGYGSLKPHKNKRGKEDFKKLVVQDDYELLGVDAVLNESNQYSKIAQFEHKEGGKDVDLEMLKSEHPELIEELKNEMKAELTEEIQKDFDDKVSAAAEEKVKEQKEAIIAEAMDSEEVKSMKEFVNTVVEAAKPLVPGQKEYVESEKQKEIDELNARLTNAEKDKEAAVQEAAELKAEKEKAEAKEKVTKHIDEKVKGHKFADQLKTRLSECSSVEEVDSSFEKEVAFINELTKNVELPTGSGQLNDNEEDDNTKKLDEEKERQRKLAGLENPEKGGK